MVLIDTFNQKFCSYNDRGYLDFQIKVGDVLNEYLTVSDPLGPNDIEPDHFGKNNVNKNEKLDQEFDLNLQDQCFDFPSMTPTKIPRNDELS